MRRAQGTLIMQGIRDLLTPRVTKLIAHATVTSDVFLDPESKYEMIVENAMEHMHATSDEANAFLLEIINLPTKKRVRGSFKPRCARACSPLGMVFSHAMGAITAVIVSAWFHAAGSTTSTMAVPSAIRWKDNRSYGHSDGGRVGVIAAAKQLFIHLNARYRIKQPENEGDVAVVHLTHGHYALICTLVREALDAVITGHNSSGSPDGDRYRRYVAEAVSLDDYLPKRRQPRRVPGGVHAGSRCQRQWGPGGAGAGGGSVGVVLFVSLYCLRGVGRAAPSPLWVIFALTRFVSLLVCHLFAVVCVLPTTVWLGSEIWALHRLCARPF